MQIRLKILKALPGSPKLALRLCCKQLKWEIDNLIGLKIKVSASDVTGSNKNFEWIKHSVIKKLTICKNSQNVEPKAEGDGKAPKAEGNGKAPEAKGDGKAPKAESCSRKGRKGRVSKKTRSAKSNQQSLVVPSWVNLIDGLVNTLKELQLYFDEKTWELYSQSALMKKNSVPNLKSLTVNCSCFQFDEKHAKMITQMSDQLETLELRVIGGFNKGIKSFDQIPASLKKLVLPDLICLEDWACLKKLISLRESLVVQYIGLLDVEMAEYLGELLTEPNFIWGRIQYWIYEELRAAALCEDYDIPFEKFRLVVWC